MGSLLFLPPSVPPLVLHAFLSFAVALGEKWSRLLRRRATSDLVREDETRRQDGLCIAKVRYFTRRRNIHSGCITEVVRRSSWRAEGMGRSRKGNQEWSGHGTTKCKHRARPSSLVVDAPLPSSSRLMVSEKEGVVPSLTMVTRSEKRLVRGWVKFVPALA